MNILWVIIGSGMVIVPYYLFDTPLDPWPSVIAGGTGGALFLIALFTWIMVKTPFPKRTKIVSAIAFVIIFAAGALSWQTMYEMCHYQQKLLGTIRTTIGDGVLRSFTSTAMLPPLHDYYAKNQRRQMPIGKLFLTANKDRIHDGYFKFDSDEYQVSFLKDVSDTSIALVMIDTVARGRDAAFKNFNGQTGRLQAKAILTERGVQHEREN